MFLFLSGEKRKKTEEERKKTSPCSNGEAEGSPIQDTGLPTGPGGMSINGEATN